MSTDGGISHWWIVLQVSIAQARSQASNGLAGAFANDYPTTLKVAGRQLSDKSVKVKSGILRLLKELLLIDPAKFAGNTSQIMSGVLSALKVTPISSFPWL